MTECNQRVFPFEVHFARHVVARFDGAQLTTDGGALLLRAVDRKIGLLKRVARCFTDARDPARTEHALSELLAQRIYALALGYEDLNDHEELRRDPLLAILAGKRELHEPLAGKSTLNRLELTPAGEPHGERYHKITYSARAKPWTRCWWRFFWRPMPSRRKRWCWIWTPQTRRCTESKKRVSFMATMATTAICRCTSLRANTCCARACGPRIRTPAPGAWKKWNAWCGRCASAGRMCASFCAPTRASVAKN